MPQSKDKDAAENKIRTLPKMPPPTPPTQKPAGSARPGARPYSPSGPDTGGNSAKFSGSAVTKQDELRLLVNSRHPIITVETPEEERIDALLMSIATELDVPVYTWTITTGLARMKGAPMYNTDTPEQALTNIDLIHGDGIFILKDFARYCDNDKICRRLRDLTEKFRGERRSIVITAASLQLPPDLLGDSIPFQIGLPTPEELLPAVRTAVVELSNANHIPLELNGDGMRQLAVNLMGLPQEEALRSLRLSILSRRKIDESLLDAVLDAKRSALRGDGLLESIRRDKSFTDVSGLTRLRDWINKRKS